MVKQLWATIAAVLMLAPSLPACSVTVNPLTGEVTAVPQNATAFPQSGGTGGGGGGGPQQPTGPIVSYKQIERGPDARLRVPMFAKTYDQMLKALDPDLKKEDGSDLDPYERTFRFQGKLSQAAEVMHALDVAARLQTEGEAPTDEEVRHAEEVLSGAIKELTDDVPDVVRAQVMHDPRKIWLLAGCGLLAFAIGCAVLYRQKQRQLAAA